MVAFNFNFYGYDYERGITVLTEGLSAATEALERKRADAAAEWKVYEHGITTGEIEEEEERDEETGSLLWSRSLVFEHDIKLIDEGVLALRKAYVIALYHHWERIVRQWTDAPTGARHDKLVKRVKAKGVEPPERFGHVYLLNNVLKHNSETAGPQLLERWPELFWNAGKLRERVAKDGTPIRWENTIIVGEKAMVTIIETMKVSGPVSHIPDR
jgi:hypothetical protein